MPRDTGFKSGACERYEALLEDYLNGELSGADARVASEHWQNCAACGDALQNAAASLRLLHAAEPSADPGPGFAHMVMARIRTAETEYDNAGHANFWQPFVSLGWRFVASATFAVGLLVSYNAGLGHRLQPTGPQVRPIDSMDLFAPEPAGAPANRSEVLMMVADNSHAKY
ncbi:MAG TPA: zf-HC2 domain-containing protein [Candidatus Acidoferrales bacterium]|nr:zf-HC2 domain-containing protein [Candidatus Acidoferrales bacterium]